MIGAQSSQCARSVLMVRPTGFAYDEESAASNALQHRPKAISEKVKQQAMQEFQRMVFELNEHDVDVLVMDPFDPHAPDAVFPNNWFTTHADGTIIRYPMMVPDRRAEWSDTLSIALRKNGFSVRRVIDLSPLERAGIYMEGTGSLVLDRQAMIAYAGISARTDKRGFEAFEKRTGFNVVAFDMKSRSGTSNYHTDVVLSVGSQLSFICSSVFVDRAEHEFVLDTISSSMKTLLTINESQMNAFCGNVIEIQDRMGKSIFAMSTTAYNAFTPRQLEVIASHGKILALDIPTIEQVGGGSVRSMLAEIFLPRMKSHI